mmetsp:Transcript_1189/g.2019  ORF Transcript_1189/g.2019 Transcript_1189/m.2019 type:complete len:266 (+) Transcript_1189:111-908(+)
MSTPVNGSHSEATGKEKSSKRRRVSDTHATEGDTNHHSAPSARVNDALKSGVVDDESVVCGDDWRHQLEELKRRCPRSRPIGEEPARVDESELLSLAQRAVSSQEETDWGAFASYSKLSSDNARTRPVTLVVKQLNSPQCVDLLRLCIRRYRSHPKEQHFCGIWILQMLQHRRSLLFSSQELVEVLKDFLRHLDTEASADPWTSQALACLGSWRLAAGVAQKQRRQREAQIRGVVAVTGGDGESANEDTSGDEDDNADGADSDED